MFATRSDMSEKPLFKEFTFLWKINNFLSCTKLNGEYLLSPEFTAESLHRTKWYLQIFPRGDTETNEECISCFLYRSGTDIGSDSINISFKLELVNEKDHLLKSNKMEKCLFKRGYNFGWHQFIENQEGFFEDSETLILRCHMEGLDTGKSPATECTARTEIDVNRCYFTWKVKNHNSRNWIESKIFASPGTSQFEIILTAPSDDIYIKIYKTEEENSILHLTCRMSLLDIKGLDGISRRKRHLFQTSSDVLEFPTFIKKSFLKAEESKYLKNGAFTLRCEFVVSNETTYEGIEEYREKGKSKESSDPDIVDNLVVLQEDLHCLFTSKKEADIKLRVENKVLPAHKCLLSARSPVFSAMFDKQMLESQTGFVDIPDVDVTIMNLFLEFIYTGALNSLDYENAMKLLVVADKYQVTSLKEKCGLFLTSVLSVGNVCAILAISDLVSHKQLKASAIDYIIADSDTVLTSKEWASFIEHNSKIASEVLCALSSANRIVKDIPTVTKIKQDCSCQNTRFTFGSLITK